MHGFQQIELMCFFRLSQMNLFSEMSYSICLFVRHPWAPPAYVRKGRNEQPSVQDRNSLVWTAISDAKKVNLKFSDIRSCLFHEHKLIATQTARQQWPPTATKTRASRPTWHRLPRAECHKQPRPMMTTPEDLGGVMARIRCFVIY